MEDVWTNSNLAGMDLITDETDVEPTNGLNEFLALSCSPSSSGNDSSIISTSDTSADSTSSPSSFESSFTKAVPESSPVLTEKYVEALTLNEPVSDKPSESVDCVQQNCDKEIEVENIIEAPQQNNDREIKVETVIEAPQQNGAVTESVDKSGKKHNQSKLPTPSEKLKNCSSLSRSPVKNTQLEYLKLLRDIDVSANTSSQMESQCLSDCSNHTYVVSDDSCGERLTDVFSTSGTSEASSLNSTFSMDASKKSKLPKIKTGPPVKSSKLVKPATKSSLLPSKTSNLLTKTSRNLPTRKFGGKAAPPNKPVKSSIVPKKASLRNQENAGVSSISSNPPPKISRPLSRTRVRKSSIPKPVAVSQLHKSQSSHTLGEINLSKSEHCPVVHSTPIKQTGTPCRKRPLPADLAGEVGESSQVLMSSIEGSAATKAVETPKTVTKRRSLLPIPIVGVEASKNGTVSSNSPVLPKKSVKPRVLQAKQGLPKPKVALKPRNGRPTARTKQSGPVKPFVRSGYNLDGLEMAGECGGSKVVHSPVNKEDIPSTPHSKWSPIKKTKNFNGEDASYMCTKRTVKY